MRTIDNSYGQVVVFDSVAEAVAACNGRSYQPSEEKLGRRLPTWQSVVDALDQPWREGLDAVQKFIDKLVGQELPEIESVVRRTRYNEDDGDEIDLDRMRAGQPYWRVSRRESTTGPTEVTIVFNLSASKSTSAVDILWRGAAAIAMAHVLENAGFSVAIWAVCTSCPYADDQYHRLTAAIPLKAAGNRLDISTLVNCASGWFYRSVLFTLTRTVLVRAGKKVAKGLGAPETPYTQDLDLFSSPTNRLFSGNDHTYHSSLWAAEYGLEQVSDNQQPDVQEAYIEPEPTPEPLPVADSKPAKKKTKPVKVKPWKAPKRQTQD